MVRFSVRVVEAVEGNRELVEHLAPAASQPVANEGYGTVFAGAASINHLRGYAPVVTHHQELGHGLERSRVHWEAVGVEKVGEVCPIGVELPGQRQAPAPLP